MLKLFEKCPACGKTLVITECRCPSCELELRGAFQPGPLALLPEDQQTFVRVFLRTRGNLSEVENVLGISYPTIRNKLDEVNKTLDRLEAAVAAGTAEAAAAEAASVAAARAAAPLTNEEKRKEILQQISAGALSAAEGLQKLKSLP